MVPEAAAAGCPHCGGALPQMRFRLHPASAPADGPDADHAPAPVAAAPRAAPAAAAGAAAARASPSRALQRPARPTAAPASGGVAAVASRLRPMLDDRRLMVVAVVLLLVVFGSGTAAYLEFSPTARYPERYLVDDDEMPAGLSNAPVSPELRDDHEIDENPGRMNADQLEDVSAGSSTTPEEGWVQVLGDPSGEPMVAVLALRFEDAEAADGWVRSMMPVCAFGGGRVYQHGSVAVLVAVEDSDGIARLNDVADVLLDKSRLERAC